MSLPLDQLDPKARLAGTTELSWCQAVPGGTGITVLALLLSKPPDVDFLRAALRKLQISHPILNSKLRFDSAAGLYSYVIPPEPRIEIRRFDLQSTAQILQTEFPDEYGSSSPFHLILEHELNTNSWQNPNPSLDEDLFFASLYDLDDNRWGLALRFHTSICDRSSALALLGALLKLYEGEEMEGELEVTLPIEDYVPSGQGSKPFWARGVDMLGYSLNSFRLGNLTFEDTASPRMSRVVRLQMDADNTSRLLSSCEVKEIKLCALIAAAGLLACHFLKGCSEGQWEKYSVVTLIDCRPILDPALNSNQIGFYHSAILNSHDIKGGEDLVELAERVNASFENAKNNKKHFSDMADVNFLMRKAIENPGLTPSASLRTSLISVFEDAVIDHSRKVHQDIGLEDFIGCSSTHGVGPSIAIFDVIQDGELNCACVFPFPLHSRKQMQEFIDEMKHLILDGTT